MIPAEAKVAELAFMQHASDCAQCHRGHRFGNERLFCNVGWGLWQGVLLAPAPVPALSGSAKLEPHRWRRNLPDGMPGTTWRCRNPGCTVAMVTWGDDNPPPLAGCLATLREPPAVTPIGNVNDLLARVCCGGDHDDELPAFAGAGAMREALRHFVAACVVAGFTRQALVNMVGRFWEQAAEEKERAF